MIEKEIKVLLNQDQFWSLHQTFPWNKVYTQDNYYFDTNNFDLLHAGITCRIRDVFGKKTIQLKHKNTSTDNFCTNRIEREVEIDHLPKQISLSHYFPDSELNITPITLQGCLRTNRHEYFINRNCHLFLDENHYLGLVDYELEIEFSTTADKAKELLLMLGLEITPIRRGKYARFVQAHNNTMPH